MKKDNITSSEEQEKLATRAGDLILSRVFTAIDLRLNETQRRELAEAFSGNDEKQKALMMKKYIPNFGELVNTEMLRLAKEIKKRKGT